MKNKTFTLQEDDDNSGENVAIKQLGIFGWFFQWVASFVVTSSPTLEEYLLKKNHRYFSKDTASTNPQSFELDLQPGTTLKNVFDDIKPYYEKINGRCHKEGNMLIVAWVDPAKPDEQIQIEIVQPNFEPLNLFGKSARATCKITIS